jgi:hypothetical protein
MNEGINALNGILDNISSMIAKYEDAHKIMAGLKEQQESTGKTIDELDLTELSVCLTQIKNGFNESISLIQEKTNEVTK